MRLFRSRRAEQDLADYAEAIRPELAGLPVPPADDALWQRVVTTRSAGVRGILPDVTPRRRSRRPAVTLGLAAAAAVIALLLPRLDRAFRSARSNAADPVGGYGVFGSLAFAQELADHGPLLPPIRVTKPGSVRPLALQFAHRLRDSIGRVTSEELSDLRIVASERGGVPAWRIVTHDPDMTRSQLRIADETLYVARADLRVLERAVHVRPYSRYDRINVTQRFIRDSVTGRMVAEGADSRGVGRPIARRLPPEFGPYITDSFASVFLVGVELTRSSSASVSVVGWAVRDNDVFLPMELRVEGDDVVQSPAGRFDCWRLSIRYAGKQVWYWARKSDGVGVRVLDATQQGTVGTREVLLTRGN